jgi:hypothetical protein
MKRPDSIFVLIILVLFTCCGTIPSEEENIQLATPIPPKPIPINYGNETADSTSELVSKSDSPIVDGLFLLPKYLLVDTISQLQLGKREEGYYYHKGKRKKCVNCGEDVEKYLAAAGLKRGQPWCAAFVKWCLDSAGVENSLNGSAISAVKKNNIIYTGNLRNKNEINVKKGDVFTLYYKHLKRIGHTGFITKMDGKSVYTIEGNTNVKGSREGDGVYMKRRPLSTIYNISRWTD